ncbi:DUF6578 domain-containing protein [uncultured Microbacterium sp.]|uniref:DUF6578 domain-containing protein n=1 Tax=uncultured Microbacterium sp. TaxID=191216 RepID=UPI0034574A33
MPAPAVTRVWLDRWEWACCGESFGVGDEVDLLVATRTFAGVPEERRIVSRTSKWMIESVPRGPERRERVSVRRRQRP